MIFRNLNDNNLKSINKLDYLTDKEYIEELKNIFNYENKKINTEINTETNTEINLEINIKKFLEKNNIPNIEGKDN